MQLSIIVMQFKREFLEKFQALDKSQPDTFMILDETILIDSVKQKLGRGHCEDASQSHWLAVNERSMTCWILNQVGNRTSSPIVHWAAAETCSLAVRCRRTDATGPAFSRHPLSCTGIEDYVRLVLGLSACDCHVVCG